MRIANRPSASILLPLLAFRIAFANGSLGPILSEAMADPAAIADAQGEFLEIGNPGPDTLRVDSLRIEVDAQSLALRNLSLRPGGLFLICRDSLPASNGGMHCGRQWSGLSLANARACAVRLAWLGGSEDYTLPAPKAGVSWENTWEEGGGYQRFLPSQAPWAGKDSATPGGRNSRSVRRAERDLGITQVTWAPSRAGAPAEEGVLQVRVADCGFGNPPRAFLSLRLDADWDGEAETRLDSIAAEIPAAGETVLRISMGAGLRGIVRAALVGETGVGPGEDEDPGNDVSLLPVEPGRPLAFTEWHAAPAAGEAEWVEVRNRTADSGGIGRKLNLARARFNGLGLGANPGGLEPGEFLVLTGSLEKFSARYGSLKARVLQIPGWKTLRNTGDTLVLALAGFTVDSVVYGKGEGTGEGADSPAQAGGASAADAPGTPGYAAAAVAADAWALSGKLVEDGRPLDVEVSLVRGGFVLRLFDLEGDLVRELGRGGPGRSVIGWDGTGAGGRGLPNGPYILGLSIDGRRTWREVVLLRGAP